MIHHRPLFDTGKIEGYYSEKDGVDIKYVCTSDLGGETFARDIFYRETPHPEFGNHYFGVFIHPQTEHFMIGDADAIELVEFTMIKGSNGFEYSRHRHDFFDVPGSGLSIDGGRAYFRCVGDAKAETKTFKVKDGEFVE